MSHSSVRIRLGPAGAALSLRDKVSHTGMDTLTRDRGKILHMYDLGMEDAQKLRSFLGRIK